MANERIKSLIVNGVSIPLGESIEGLAKSSELKTKLSEFENDCNYKGIVTLTQAAYDALETKDANTLYIISDYADTTTASVSFVNSAIENIQNQINTITGSEEDVDTVINNLKNISDFLNKYSESDNLQDVINTAKSEIYGVVDTSLGLKADKSDTYTKKEVDDAISGLGTTIDIDSYYNKTEVDGFISTTDSSAQGYANTAKTDAEAYTDTQLESYSKTTDIDSSLALKANVADVYDKTAADGRFARISVISDTASATDNDVIYFVMA